MKFSTNIQLQISSFFEHPTFFRVPSLIWFRKIQADESVTAFSMEGEEKLDTSHLAKQDLKTLDVAKLHPLSPEVISRQATINIGTIGHVAHGKSTVVKAVSGVQVLLHQQKNNPLLHFSKKIFFLFATDCPFQERTCAQYHHQAGLCQCQGLQV